MLAVSQGWLHAEGAGVLTPSQDIWPQAWGSYKLGGQGVVTHKPEENPGAEYILNLLRTYPLYEYVLVRTTITTSTYLY